MAANVGFTLTFFDASHNKSGLHSKAAIYASKNVPKVASLRPTKQTSRLSGVNDSWRPRPRTRASGALAPAAGKSCSLPLLGLRARARRPERFRKLIYAKFLELNGLKYVTWKRLRLLLVVCALAIQAQFLDTEKELISANISRNEIFARKGFIFRSAALTAYFKQFNWYKPSQVMVELNEDEKKQSRLLTEKEEANYERLSSMLLGFFDHRETAPAEYYSVVKKIELEKGVLRTQIEKATKDIPYRSPDIFVIGFRLQKREETKAFEKKIKKAIADEITLAPYYKVQKTPDGEFSRIEGCYADYINHEHCATEFILRGDKVLYVSHGVNQTTYDQHWHFVYNGGKLFLGRFYFRQMGKVIHDFRFYFES